MKCKNLLAETKTKLTHMIQKLNGARKNVDPHTKSLFGAQVPKSTLTKKGLDSSCFIVTIVALCVAGKSARGKD